MALPPPPRVPQPQVDRADLLDKMGIKPREPKRITPPAPQISTPVVAPPSIVTADPEWQKPQKQSNVFDIPVIGPLIDLIDTPRAAIVSTIKEVGDLFAGDGFSVTDWWSQTDNNMMMGEVLRDWGVELGGPWDFALGLGLDIALDPLTYLLGGAVAARYANTDDVANALFRAGDAAEKAKDTVKAKNLRSAGNTVKAKGSIHAAGKEALQEIGLDTGLRFTVFGTGRVSKQFVEKPLRKFFPELGEKLDLRRIEQLPQVGAPDRAIKNTSKFWRWGDEAIEGGPRFRQSIDWSDPKNKQQIINQARRIREGKNLVNRSSVSAEAGRLAQRALKMPVESKRFKLGAAPLVRVSAGAAGTLFAGATLTKVGQIIAKQMSGKAPVNIGLRQYAREGDTEMVNILLNLKRAGNQGKVHSDIWATHSWEDIRALKRDSDILGVDFDQLIMEAAVEPKYLAVARGAGGELTLGTQAVANPNLTKLGPYLSNPEWSKLHTRAQQLWQHMGSRGNAALPYSTPLQELKDEFYVMRALKGDAALNLGVVKSNNVFDVEIGGLGIDSNLRGNIFSRRKYVTPATIKEAIRNGDISLQEVYEQSDAVRNAFEVDQQIVQALRGEGTALESVQVRVAESPELFEDLKKGMSFKTVDNSIMQNRFMGTALDDVDNLGSVEAQMNRIGTDLLGDEYVEMFSKSASESLSRYVNMWQSRIRSQYVIDYTQQLGITVEGSGNAWYGRAVKETADKIAQEEAQRVAIILGETVGGKKVGKGLIDELGDATSGFINSAIERAKKIAQYDDWAARPRSGGGPAVAGAEIPIQTPIDQVGQRIGRDELIEPLAYSAERQAYDSIVNQIQTAEDKLETLEEIFALVNPARNPLGRNTLQKNRRAMLNLSPEALRLLQEPLEVGKSVKGQARAKLTRKQMQGVSATAERAKQLKTYEEAVEFLRELAEEVRLLEEYRNELAAFIKQMREPTPADVARAAKSGKEVQGLDLPFHYLHDQVLMIDEGILTAKRWIEDSATRYIRNVIETDATTIMADALYDLSMRGLAGHYRWATPQGAVTLPLRSVPQPLWEMGGRYNKILNIALEEYDPRWYKSTRESWTGHAEPLPLGSSDNIVTTPHIYSPRFHEQDGISKFWQTLRFSSTDPLVNPAGVPFTTPNRGLNPALAEWIRDPVTGKYRLPNAKEMEEIQRRGGMVGEGIPYEGRPIVVTVDPDTPIGQAILKRQAEAIDAGVPKSARERGLFTGGQPTDVEAVNFLKRIESGVEEGVAGSGIINVTPEQLLTKGGQYVPPDAPVLRGTTKYTGKSLSEEAVDMGRIQREGRLGYARSKPEATTDPRPSLKRDIVDVPTYATKNTGSRVVYDIPEYQNPVTKVREAAKKTGDTKSVTWAGYLSELEELLKTIDDEVLFYGWYSAIESIPDAARVLEDVGQRSTALNLESLLSSKEVKNFIKTGNIGNPSAQTTTITEAIELLETAVTGYRAVARYGSDNVSAIQGLSGKKIDPKAIDALETKLAELKSFKDLQSAIVGNAQQRLNKIINDFNSKRERILQQYTDARTQIDEISAAIDAKNLGTKRIVDNLTLELDEMRKSIVTKERLSAIDNQKEAVKEIRKVRNYSAFADAYGGAASEFLLSMTPFAPALQRITPPSLGGVTLKSQGISGATKRALNQQSLIGTNISESQIASYAEAFQAVAKTQDPASFGFFMQKYMPLVNYWKSWAVSTTGFFMRNLLGGTWINSAINDVPMHYHARVNEIRRLAVQAGETQDVLEGIDALIAAGKSVEIPTRWTAVAGPKTVTLDELKAFKMWNDAGLGGSGQVSIEIKSQMDEFATWKTSLRPWKQKSWDPETRTFIPNDTEYMVQRGNMKIWTPDFKPISWIRGRNQDVEYMLRGALAHNMIMSGYNLDEAMEAVVRYHFDYTDLTQAERRIKGVIPFWTWQKHIVPVLVESIGKKPAAWGRLQQVKAELELHSPAEGVVPDYFGENMGIRLPFKTGSGRVYWMPDLPFRDLTKWTKDMDSSSDLMGIPQNFWRVSKESAFPPIKLPFELWAGKQSFADIPLTGRYQQAPTWADIPVIREALLTTGLANKGPRGHVQMRDKHIYMFDQILPIFGRMRRLYPNERRKQAAFTTTFINTFFGAGIRVNSSMEKMSQQAKVMRLLEENRRDYRDLLYRSV